jgi:hypothetical protein
MAAMLGALSMVVDAGVAFVIQRQLQTAADAAALAAVWYPLACSPSWDGCQPTNADPEPPECMVPPNDAAGNQWPCTAAVETIKANWGVALSLCAGPNLPTGSNGVGISIVTQLDGSIVVPAVQPYAVILTCNAPHWFARVLPGVDLTMTIGARASAASGWVDTNGHLSGSRNTPSTPLVARLLK